MDLHKIELTQAAFSDIEATLDETFGAVTFDQLDDKTFLEFSAALIAVSYKIGFRNGVASIKLKK